MFAVRRAACILTLFALLLCTGCPPIDPPQRPLANFFATPTNGEAPLEVAYTDTSVPGAAAITSWSWSLGDGATSTQRNPTHTYTVPGTYTVSLRVTSADGQDTFERSGYITVLAPSVQELPFDLLYDTTNPQAVVNAPAAPVIISVSTPVYLGRLTHYHWNNGAGKTPGSIWLEDAEGRMLGPWQATGLHAQGGATNVFWRVYPELLLTPGTYTILDSDPASWSQNAGSEGRGFLIMEGWVNAELARASIGGAGGALEAPGIRIEVPPNAFDSERLLTLGYLGVVHGADTPAYNLTGLPEALHEPLRISMIAEGEIGEAAHIELQETVLVDGEQEALHRWAVLPTTVAGNVLEGVLPPYARSSAKEGLSPEAVAVLRTRLKQLKVRSPGLKFIFTCPIAVAGQNYAGGIALAKMREYGAVLDTSYQLLTTQLGFSFEGRPQERWPVEVLFGEFPGEDGRTVWGRCCYSPRGREFDWLEINSKMLQRESYDQEFKATMVHELMHLAQGLAVNPDTSKLTGLREMFSVWSEWRLLGAAYKPVSFGTSTAALFPLNGLLRDTESAVLGNDRAPSPARHGYASGLFLRQLFPPNATSDSLPGQFWQSLALLDDPVAAFEVSAGENWAATWRDFARNLYSGRVSGTGTPGELMIEGSQGDIWMVSAEEPAGTYKFPGTFPALSARPYLISMGGASEPGLPPLDLTVTPGAFTSSMELAVYHFTLDGAEPAPLLGACGAGETVTVENVSALGNPLIGLVVTQTATTLAAPVQAELTCQLALRPTGVWQLQEVAPQSSPAENTARYTFEAEATREGSTTGVRWMGRDYPEDGPSTPYEVFIRSRRTWTPLPQTLTPGQTVNTTLSLEMSCTPDIFRYIDFNAMPDLTSLIYMRDGQGTDINGDRSTYISARSERLTGNNTLTDTDTIPWTVPAGNYAGQEFLLTVMARDAGPSGLESSGSYNDYLQTARVTYRYVYAGN